MGKYPNSKIHDMYSDWHWKLIKENEKYKRLYVSDIDRLWIEYNFKRETIVCVVDIKWEKNNNDLLLFKENEDYKDTITPTEKGIYEWFNKSNIPVYIVFITSDFKKFRVIRFDDGKTQTFNDIEYADFLLSKHL